MSRGLGIQNKNPTIIIALIIINLKAISITSIGLVVLVDVVDVKVTNASIDLVFVSNEKLRGTITIIIIYTEMNIKLMIDLFTKLKI